MTLIVDNNEKLAFFAENADAREPLFDIEQGVDEGAKFSYDFKVTTPGGRVLRFERKAWPDFVASWDDGKLERQVSAVNGLIVEFDVMELMDAAPMQRDNESQEEYLIRRKHFRAHQQNAIKHLSRLSANVWTIYSMSPQDTLAILRWIEKEGDDLSIKPNRVKTVASHPLHRVLDAVGQVNMHRSVGDGRMVADLIAPLVDTEKLVEALNLPAWSALDLGPGRRKIAPGTCARIATGLRAPLRASEGSQEPPGEAKSETPEG